MARSKKKNPLKWEDLNEDQKWRLDQVFRIFMEARRRRLAAEAKP